MVWSGSGQVQVSRAHLELVAQLGDQLAHERRGRRLAAQVQLVAAEAKQRARPGPPALLVAHHLHLVNDAHADCKSTSHPHHRSSGRALKALL